VTNLNVIALANHLWQSTLFALVVGCLTLLLRKNGARVRCLLWLAASAKFLIPFALLTAIGSQIPWPSNAIHVTGLEFMAIAGHAAAQVTQVSAERAPALAQASHTAKYDAAILIGVEVLWALGALAVAVRWISRWLLVRRALHESTATGLAFIVPVRSSASQLEPALVGVLRPVLLLPKDLEDHLASAEMDAVLAHEACHVAWRDNLAAALHMLVEALFWFYPLVWWLGTRVVEERERACDEHVLAQGHSPRSYAEGLLKVCERYLESDLACVAGIGGANLSRRIEAIMKNRLTERLGTVRKLAIVLAASAAIAVPIGVGVLNSPRALALASTLDENQPALHNISIQLAPPDVNHLFTNSLYLDRDLRSAGGVSISIGGIWIWLAEHGRVRVQSDSLRDFIASAYGVNSYQVFGRDWSNEPNYLITADDPGIGPKKVADALQSGAAGVRDWDPFMRDLLAKQFGLVVSQERKQVDGYVLTVSSDGARLSPDAEVPGWKKGLWAAPQDGIDATGFQVSTLAGVLQRMLQAPVIDRTGLRGTFDYKVEWKRPAPGTLPDPAALRTALEEQLGLHLEPKPVTVDAINVVSLKSPDQIITTQ